MKKTLRMLALLLALLTLCGAAIPAMAAAKPSIVTETLWAGCEYYSCITFKNMPDDAKVVSIKSSNPKIIQVKVFSDDLYDHYLIPLKTGKSKITVKYKINGKAGTVSATYTVKKYPNPLTSIQVNGSKINIKANKYFYNISNYTKGKATITLKPAKGWKIAGTWGYTVKEGDDSTFKEFFPKNGKAFKIKKGYTAGAFFNLVNSKGETIQYGLNFYPN